jgi:hypothetical protein
MGVSGLDWLSFPTSFFAEIEDQAINAVDVVDIGEHWNWAESISAEVSSGLAA